MTDTNPNNLQLFFEENKTPLSSDIPILNRAIQILFLCHKIRIWYYKPNYTPKFQIYKELLEYPFEFDMYFSLHEIPFRMQYWYITSIAPRGKRVMHRDGIPSYLSGVDEIEPIQCALLYDLDNVFVLIQLDAKLILINVATLDIFPISSFEECISYLPSHVSVQATSIGRGYPMDYLVKHPLSSVGIWATLAEK
jgi:hypothetical protein